MQLCPVWHWPCNDSSCELWMDKLVIAASSVTCAHTRRHGRHTVKLWVTPIWTDLTHRQHLMQRGPLIVLKHLDYPKSYISVSCTDVVFKHKETSCTSILIQTACFSVCMSTCSLLPVSKPLDLLQSFKADINDSYLDG